MLRTSFDGATRAPVGALANSACTLCVFVFSTRDDALAMKRVFEGRGLVQKQSAAADRFFFVCDDNRLGREGVGCMRVCVCTLEMGVDKLAQVLCSTASVCFADGVPVFVLSGNHCKAKAMCRELGLAFFFFASASCVFRVWSLSGSMGKLDGYRCCTERCGATFLLLKTNGASFKWSTCAQAYRRTSRLVNGPT